MFGKSPDLPMLPEDSTLSHGNFVSTTYIGLTIFEQVNHWGVSWVMQETRSQDLYRAQRHVQETRPDPKILHDPKIPFVICDTLGCGIGLIKGNKNETTTFVHSA